MAVELETLETRFTGNDRDLKRAFREGERASRQFAQNVRRDLGSVSSAMTTAGGGLKGTGIIGQLAEGLKMLPGIGTLAKAVGVVADKIEGGIRLGIDYNRVLEESRLGFTRLFGSADRADEFIGKLQELRREGIALDEAAAASRRFLASRFDREQIPAYISAVGDAARFTGAEVNAITRALTQMASKGRVSAEEVNQQLAEQGIPAWRYLADEVARTNAEFEKLSDEQRIARVQKMAERGQLSGMGGAQAILRGIQRDFGGFSRDFAEQTATGLENQLAEAVKRQLGTAEGPLFDRYKGLLKGTLDTVNSEAVSALARGIAGHSNAAFNSLDAAIREGGNIGSGLIQGVAGKGFEAAKGFIKEFATGIGSNSPATEFIPLGVSAAQGFKIGFSAEMGAAGGVMGLFQGGRGPLSPGVTRYDPIIERIAREIGIDPNLIRAVMQQESGGRGVTSHAGAQGPMQLMPGTARRFGVSNPFDPEQAIRGGGQYLKWLSDRYGGNLDLILAGYNAGEGNVDRHGGIPPFRETQNYVRSVRGIYGQLGMSRGGWGQRSQPAFSSLDAGRQLQSLWGIPEFRAWYQAYTGAGGGDLTGGVGVFADGSTGGNFRDVPEGSGLEDLPAFASLHDLIPEVRLEAVKLTQVFDRPLIPFPGAQEGVKEINGEIRQTVPLLMKAEEASRFLGAEVRDIAGATQGSFVEFFSSTEGGFKGMAGRMVLAWSQSVSQMIIEAQMARLTEKLFGTFDASGKSQGGGWLGKLFGWGLGALTGGGGGAGGVGSAAGSLINAGGFARGGSFTVGGTGGTDRTPVFFMATRGEEVTVETPGQQGRGSTRVINLSVNFNSPDSTPRNRQTLAQTARQLRNMLEHEVSRGG